MALLRVLFVASILEQASCLSLRKSGEKLEPDNPFCMEGRVAPSVFLMGYQKSGSTSLWNDLKDNYNLKPATPIEGEDGFRNKEVSFFSNDQRYAKGKHFYLKHFPTCPSLKHGAVMDASPNTIFGGEKTAKRVKEFYGDKAKDLKFIVIARDPTTRMQSAYWHFQPGLDGSFDKYVEKTIQQAKLWAAGEGDAPEPNLYYPNMYSRHLKPWLEEFSPDQFAFLTMSQYTKEHSKTMKHVAARLKLTGHNAPFAYNDHRRDHPQMSEATKKTLDDFFAPHMKELETLVQESKIGLGENPVRQITFGKHSFLETEPATEASYMTAEMEEALRLEYGAFAPEVDK